MILFKKETLKGYTWYSIIYHDKYVGSIIEEEGTWYYEPDDIFYHTGEIVIAIGNKLSELNQ